MPYNIQPNKNRGCRNLVALPLLAGDCPRHKGAAVVLGAHVEFAVGFARPCQWVALQSATAFKEVVVEENKAGDGSCLCSDGCIVWNGHCESVGIGQQFLESAHPVLCAELCDVSELHFFCTWFRSLWRHEAEVDIAAKLADKVRASNDHGWRLVAVAAACDRWGAVKDVEPREASSAADWLTKGANHGGTFNALRGRARHDVPFLETAAAAQVRATAASEWPVNPENWLCSLCISHLKSHRVEWVEANSADHVLAFIAFLFDCEQVGSFSRLLARSVSLTIVNMVDVRLFAAAKANGVSDCFEHVDFLLDVERVKRYERGKICVAPSGNGRASSSANNGGSNNWSSCFNLGRFGGNDRSFDRDNL